MKRRNFLERIFLAATAALSPRRARAQQMEEPMRQLAAIVLPTSLGRSSTDRIAAEFVVWIRDYKTGAQIGSGYGHPRTQVTGPDPSAGYVQQLTALGSPIAREAVEKELTDANIDRLPPRPNGRHVASDLMAFFFNSAAGEDLLYNAQIKRDDCRGLANSGRRPEKVN
jgi:hypothetical protein